MLKKSFIYFKNNIRVIIIKLLNQFYKFQFKKVGKDCVIYRQMLLTNKNKISLGQNVVFMPNSRIELFTNYANVKFDPSLEVGDFSQIHQNCHITCAERIKIGNNVIIVSNVTITDIIHPYDDITKPMNKVGIKTNPVEIGDETYIYNNCVILPGVKIGKHCIIGANSVVNSDIPSYSIAVGNPAKIIKQYNFSSQIWE
jgi:acetyltransferase-like isoleucine patch superfamily enzyme